MAYFNIKMLDIKDLKLEAVVAIFKGSLQKSKFTLSLGKTLLLNFSNFIIRVERFMNTRRLTEQETK